MINKITKERLIEIIQKSNRKAQNITIPSDTFIVKIILNPKNYANINWTCILTNIAQNAKQLGCITLSIYSIFKTQLNQIHKFTGITDFITSQKNSIETVANFFQHFIKYTDECGCTKQSENAYAEIFWPISTINHNYI